MKNPSHRSVLSALVLLCAAVGAADKFDWAQYEAAKVRVKAIAANPDSIGDAELEYLMSHLYFPESIQAIINAKAPAAQAALWKVALDGRDGSFNAAYALVNRVTNRLEALKLLASKSPEVQAIGLRGVLGSRGDAPVSLDRAAWTLIRPALTSSNLEVREAAARVTGRDAGTEVPAAEKAEALVGALEGLERLPGAQSQVWSGVPVMLRGPRYEFACYAIIDALGDVPGLDLEFLRQRTAATTGLVRDCLLLARGRRGDPVAKDELRRLAREHPSPAFRWKAVGTFFKLGTIEDLPWLQQVAERDPFYIEKWVPGRLVSPEDEIPRDYYSVRERARAVIQEIQRRATKPVVQPPADK